MRKLISIVTIFLAAALSAFGQETYFSQFWATPVHLNPAMAGIAEGPRFSLNYRNQWPQIGDGPNGSFVNYTFGYDQHIEQLSGGIGVLLSSERVGGSLYVRNNINLVYAYQYRITSKWAVKTGISLGYTNEYIDWNELRWSDQINPVFGFFDGGGALNPTQQIPPSNTNHHIFNVHSGIVVFSDRFFGGLNIRNLINTSPEFLSEETVLRRGWNIHTGTQLPIKTKKRLDISVTPNLNYLYQFKTHQLSVGAVMNMQYVFGGLYFRHNIANPDAFILVFGVTHGMMRLGYSFDINVSPVRQNSGGTHEMSLVINLSKTKSSINTTRFSNSLRCPDILAF